MKLEKVKTIAIVILSVLFVMSLLAQMLFCALLGITDIDSFKRVMMANDVLTGFSSIGEATNNSTPSTAIEPIGTNAADNCTPAVDVVSKVLLDSNGVKITFLGVEYDTFWDSHKLKLAVENNSATDVVITSSEESVDGFMVDTSIGFYCEVLAGKKAIEYMTLYSFDLEPVGICDPKAVEFKLSVTAASDLFDNIAETGTIAININ